MRPATTSRGDRHHQPYGLAIEGGDVARPRPRRRRAHHADQGEGSTLTAPMKMRDWVTVGSTH